MIASADIAPSTQLAYVHFDADFPLTAYNDATTPARVSDHDPALAYLTVPAPVAAATLTGTAAFPTTFQGLSSTGQVFTLTNTGETTLTITTIATTGDFAQSNNCGTTLAIGATCAINVVFTPTAVGSRTGTLTVSSGATVAPVSLTGTGNALVPAPAFTLTDSNNATTTAVTVAAGSTATVGLKLTSTGGFAGPVTFTCTYTGGTLTGAACSVTSPVTLAAAGTATATVTITTIARTLSSGLGPLPGSGLGRVAFLTLATLMVGVVFAVRRAGRNVRTGGLLALLFVLAMGLGGCSSSNTTYTNPSGTPAGTYAYTVTATSGTMTHTETVNLTVQ